MAYTQKLYNEYKVKDLSWTKKVSGVYGTPLSELDGLISSPALDFVELSKFNYQGESKINGYIYPRQYFILNDYLWINFDTENPSTSKLSLQFPMDEDQVLGYSSQSYILTIQSRTNNSTYITDAAGNNIPESSRSSAPYNRTWILTDTNGVVTIHNPGVATATCFDFSGGGGGGGEYTLPPATSSTLGGVKIGSGVNVASDGTISVNPGAVDIATTSVAGIVKIGSGISVEADGTISVNIPEIVVPTKVSDLTNDLGFITLADVPAIPTNVSDFTNDVGYITSADLPTKVSDLDNDSGFITLADLPTVPTKISELTNDLGFITISDIPSIPTKVSDLTNDSGFLVASDIEGKVDKVNGKGLSTNDYTDEDRDKVLINADVQFNHWEDSQLPSDSGYGNTESISFYPRAFSNYPYCYVKSFSILIRNGGWTPPTSPMYCKLVDPSTGNVLSESDGIIPVDNTFAEFKFDSLVKLDANKRYDIKFYTTKSGTEQRNIGVRLFLASSDQDIYTVKTTWRVITKFNYYISTNDYVDAALDNKVSKTTTIAGIDLQDNITKEELKDALDIGSGGGGDTNVIEVIKVNGTELTVDPTDKSVNITGFVTDDLFETDKDIGTITISGEWSWVNADDSIPTTHTSSSNSITLEEGSKASWQGTWKWNATSDQKDATRCSGTLDGTDLPAKNTNSDLITISSIEFDSAVKSYSQTIYAPKSGLMVSGTKVVKATGEYSRSASIGVSFSRRYYFGYSSTNTITEAIIQGLATTELTTTKARTINGVQTADKYVVYAYPSSYGDLSKITMDGATPVLGAFTKIGTVSVTNPAGKAIDCIVYVSNNPGAFAQAASLKFE